MFQRRITGAFWVLLCGAASGCINGAPQDGLDGGAAGGDPATSGDPGGSDALGLRGSGATSGAGFNGAGGRTSGFGGIGGRASVPFGGSTGRGGVGGTLFGVAGADTGGTPPSPGGGAAGVPSSAGGAPSVCPDVTATACSSGIWPNGIVYYTFASGYAEQQAVRAAMDRWEAASSNAIHFVEDATRTAKVLITECTGSAEAKGYGSCTNGCTTPLCNNFDHQLGHIIGLGNEQQRYDRDHYVRLRYRCSEPGAQLPRCGLADNVSDLGPFDYESAMLYPVTDPTVQRWDGTPVCPGSAGFPCPVSTAGPGGSPTEADGAAVVELYTPSWKKLARTLDTSAPSSYDPAVQSPFSDDLSSTVTIPRTSSPAIETWEGASLAIYLRGSDDRIYKKFLNGGWTTWTSLGAPAGKGPVSDPAIVSSVPGRSDLVVVRDGKVFIMSTPTWNTWEPLPAPPVAAASGPAITSWGPDRLDVFVRGTDDQVYQDTCTASCVGSAGTWSGWNVIPGGTIRGKPAVVARQGGIIDLFVHSAGVDLWSNHYTDSAGGWDHYYQLDPAQILKWDPTCPDCCSPAAGSHDGTTADVYVRTADDKIATGSIGPNGWSGFTSLGGVSSASPAAVAQQRTTNRTDLVIVTPEENDAGEIHYGTWWKSRTY